MLTHVIATEVRCKNLHLISSVLCFDGLMKKLDFFSLENID